MNTTIESSIPTNFLPDDWRALGAAKFNCSENKIERIVYGLSKITAKNVTIYDFMLQMAEDGKAAADLLEKEFKKRIEALKQ